MTSIKNRDIVKMLYVGAFSAISARTIGSSAKISASLISICRRRKRIGDGKRGKPREDITEPKRAEEEELREFLARALGENGYIVLEAANAKEAMDIFEREKGKFHLLLTDVFLPHLGGLELVDQLLCRQPQLRVLLSSGYTDDKSQWLIIRERGFRFIPKPYALVHLLRAVREAMEPS